MPVERSIAVRTHGRYLIDLPERAPAGVVIGCHGYAESAETQHERLRRVPGVERWVVVSVQGLHRFYRGRTEDVVASWMTRQDRELMIGDNVAYVLAVAAQVLGETAAPSFLVFAGFSQGVAMAFRAASASTCGAAVVAFGGDIPPELDGPALARLRGVLIGHGSRDEWYTPAKHERDVARLRDAGARVESIALDAGHVWSEEFSHAAGRFLSRLR
jgi:predicted esterase